MRKIRDVLRLSAAGMSKRKIAASLGVSVTAAGEYIRRARRAGLTWPLPEGLTKRWRPGSSRRRRWRPWIGGRSRTGRQCTASCAGPASRCNCCGRSIAVHPDGYGYSFMRGVPAMVVSDNLRPGITKACFYEPAVNRTYAEMAAHYGTAIVAARPYRPRDKAKVEVAVQIATRFVIAKLRNRQFFSLSALNAAIAELLAQVNNRVSRHLGASRRALFEDLERSALKPLPAEPYVLAQWKECRVGLDYHIEI
jgi:hypothetical protein